LRPWVKGGRMNETDSYREWSSREDYGRGKKKRT